MEMTRTRALLRFALAFALFAAGYAILDFELMKHAILYRAAANDWTSAARAFAGISLQAVALLLLTLALPRRWFALLIVAALLSGLINVGFGIIVGDVVDLAKLQWMAAESAQAGAAAGEFAGKGAAAVAAVLVAGGLLVLARRTGRPALSGFSLAWPSALAVGAVGVAVDYAGIGPVAAERNSWIYAGQILLAPPPPARDPVPLAPVAAPRVDKVVWVIDESMVYKTFASLVRPSAMVFDPVDFGEAHALGNCSAPSNVALRSGVAVDSVNGATDLRRTPSIWGYARKAGFRTALLDGQSKGPLQNLVLPPERTLIGEYRPMHGGLDTDKVIAARINQVLKAPGRDFVYAVLMGAHFQYRDHYPPGYVPAGSPIEAQYEGAVSWSKRAFFETLFAGVDRSRVAVFYTSDHGQNVKEGVLPHCSLDPDPLEFSIPLLAFLPEPVAAPYRASSPGGRSHGQMFPASLLLMGYPQSHALGYDADLTEPSRRIVWFGRNVIPVTDGAQVEIHAGPARAAATGGR